MVQLKCEQDLACLLSLLIDGAGLTLCCHTGVHEDCGVYSFGCFPHGISLLQPAACWQNAALFPFCTLVEALNSTFWLHNILGDF